MVQVRRRLAALDSDNLKLEDFRVMERKLTGLSMPVPFIKISYLPAQTPSRKLAPSQELGLQDAAQDVNYPT